MAVAQKWCDKSLTLELAEGDGKVRLSWRGKSNDREPGRFLVPILTEALTRAGKDAALVLDFTDVDYMNSSTFAPIVKALEQAKREGIAVSLEFSRARKWQVISFNALKAFETQDGRIKLLAR